VLALGLCVVYGSQNKEQLVTCTTLSEWVFITQVDSVYCSVGSESLYITDYVSYFKV